MRPPSSLALRLLLAQVLPLALLAVALAAGGAVLAQRVVERNSDRLLAASVMAIAEQVSVRDGRPSVQLSPWSLGLLDGPERDAVFYGVRHRGRVVTGYGELPRLPHARVDAVVFGDGEMLGMPVRVAETWVEAPGLDAPVSVAVAQSLDSRRASVRELLLGLIALPVCLVGGAALLIWPATVWSLRPLRRLAAELTRRSQDLRASYAPASLDGVPSEVAPVVRAYNSLLANLERSATGLERFAADASHQLRTPLSVITANLALLAKGKLGGVEARALVQDSRDASGRLNVVLRQLLALARAEAAADAGVARLDAAARQAAVEVMRANPRAEVRVRDLRDGLHVRGDPVLVEEMLRNLLSNGAVYGGGLVFVRLCRAADGRPCAVIWDRGPGMRPAELERLFERFYRGAGSAGTVGAGLGLAIVRTLAEAFGAEMEIANRRRRGLVVRLTFQGA
ncbi:sensor histidine kinase [Phenylobacterium sp. VNQ135]|uniref:sensor histidine kinase n=1 Tax=Phenylobacterium sp. VNQ135 TaxID=3400922 RepID=UPI003C0F0A29